MNKIIDRVTVTGADDSTDIGLLKKIHEQFPFVEFGILMSRKCFGMPRFPSKEWLSKLDDAYCYEGISFSAHLCGEYVRDLLQGKNYHEIADTLGLETPLFHRVQLNTHGIKHKFNTDSVHDLLQTADFNGQHYIFQQDGANDKLRDCVLDFNVQSKHFLFDLSHGAGVVPKDWPARIEGKYCGYAGGLSPENVAGELAKLENLLTTATAGWIDAETKLRSDDN
jgi:hypothetical protein